MAWAKAGRYEKGSREMGIRHAPGDRVCEGPGSATQSSWTREDETLWVGHHGFQFPPSYQLWGGL